MSIHDDMGETLRGAFIPRPLLVRVVHIESQRVVNEFEVDPAMTGPEIQHWLEYIEAVTGPDYEVEIPGSEAA